MNLFKYIFFKNFDIIKLSELSDCFSCDCEPLGREGHAKGSGRLSSAGALRAARPYLFTRRTKCSWVGLNFCPSRTGETQMHLR